MEEGLEKLVKKAILSMVSISMLFLSSRCYSKVPITEIPTYKQPIKTSKVIKEQSQEKTKIASNETYKQPGKLENLADPSTFRPNMPFSEAIDILRNSTSPPLNIAVLWKDLNENADVYRDTPIGIDGVSKVPFHTHLKLLLSGVSAGATEKLGYVVDGGVITIATQDSLPKKMTARVYDVSDLVAPSANFRFMPGMGMPIPFGGYGSMGYGQRAGGYGAPYGGYGGMGYGSMPFGGMMPGRGFRGYGRPYGGVGYGGIGMPYGSYGEPTMMRGYRTRVGSIPTGTSLNVNPPIIGNYRYNRSSELAGELIDLIEASIPGR